MKKKRIGKIVVHLFLVLVLALSRAFPPVIHKPGDNPPPYGVVLSQPLPPNKSDTVHPDLDKQED